MSMSELVLFLACLNREFSSGASFVSTIVGGGGAFVSACCSSGWKTVVSRLVSRSKSTLKVGRSKLGNDLESGIFSRCGVGVVDVDVEEEGFSREDSERSPRSGLD